ncbi:oligosaccharyl transferase subunit [Ascobolus immersus RN42]|uniref:Dolichyl-diphosphooligosaccharide--protein glycosyltransferase subunit OST2 n=1 Tax=Ascobolus immersus RN42 TaxID=1160509 RepID=A0A3N4IMK9_ASCIM|nr:oligosaccharyl transferase subunit [Ascobolus immersus RN42]
MARKTAAASGKTATPSGSARSTTPTPPIIPTTTNTISKKPSSTAPPLTGNTFVLVWNQYLATTPQRIRLLDVFLGFLIVVGVLQFVYCVIGGNYPFNAFLAGFSATVGQFVLTVALRMQTVNANRKEFEGVSPERAFADFVFGSLLLHVFCVNFIN